MSRGTGPNARADAGPAQWELRLYIAGQTQKSVAAFANLRRICEEHLKGKYRIEVIDLPKNPQLAEGDQIVAIPTLVRKRRRSSARRGIDGCKASATGPFSTRPTEESTFATRPR